MTDKENLPPLSRTSTEPLHRQLSRIILERILGGEYAGEEKLPGMGELAKQFGVSAITVNQALDRLIREGYCFRRPKKGTFITPGARTARPSKTGTVILYSTHDNSEIDLVDTPFYTSLRRTAEQTPPVNLLIISGKHAPEQLAVQLEETENILGVVLIAVNEFASALNLARSHPHSRFVLLNYQYDGFEQLAPENLRGVFSDEFGGGYMAASELFAGGARNIGILQYEVEDENYHLRIRGVRQAHIDHGIPFQETHILNVRTELPLNERGGNGIAELIARDPRLDTVFCVNDILAAGAARHLALTRNERNIRIIGYDNHIPELHIANRFSTVSINSAAMSSAAVRMLLHPEDYPCKQLLISPRIIHF